jgi:hypothetical protein
VQGVFKEEVVLEIFSPLFVFTMDRLSKNDLRPTVLESVVVRYKETFVHIRLNHLVCIDEPAAHLAKDNVSDFIVSAFYKGQQGTAFQDGKHGIAEALHFSCSNCF